MSENHYHSDTLTDKVRNIIEIVLHHYDINVHNITRVRSVYKVESDKGTLCVKRVKHGKRKAENGYFLVENLKKNNFHNTANYYKTFRGNYYVEYGKRIYYVTSWIEGTECDVGDINEAIGCVELLAKFHNSAKSIDLSNIRLKNNLKNWPKIFYTNVLDMEKYKSYINRKVIRTQFDTLYYDYIDMYYQRGLTALTFLNNSNYYKLSKEANNEKTICHNSFYYQNIIKKQDDYYLIDLDSVMIDLQIMDLGNFIRRLMSKSEYQWDFNKARILIEHYSSFRAISAEELEIILSLLIFPYRFWKLGKKRYVKHKGWSETKYLKKLNKILKYSLEEQRFIESFMNYINMVRGRISFN